MTTKINKIGIFGKPNNKNLYEIIEKIFIVVENIDPKIHMFVEKSTAECSSIKSKMFISKLSVNIETVENLKNSIDLAVILGGDGTLLGIARQVASAGVYVLGINQGKLGFTTDLDVNDLQHNLGSLLRGEGIVEKRSMFDLYFYKYFY